MTSAATIAPSKRIWTDEHRTDGPPVLNNVSHIHQPATRSLVLTYSLCTRQSNPHFSAQKHVVHSILSSCGYVQKQYVAIYFPTYFIHLLLPDSPLPPPSSIVEDHHQQRGREWVAVVHFPPLWHTPQHDFSISHERCVLYLYATRYHKQLFTLRFIHNFFALEGRIVGCDDCCDDNYGRSIMARLLFIVCDEICKKAPIAPYSFMEDFIWWCGCLGVFALEWRMRSAAHRKHVENDVEKYVR